MPVINLDNDRTLKALKTELAQEDFRDAGWGHTGSFGVRVARGGKKVFFVTYAASKEKRRLKLGEYPAMSLAEARKEALQAIARVTKGEDPSVERKVRKSSDSVDDLFSTFIQHRTIKNFQGTGPTAATTLRNWRLMYDKDVSPKIGLMKAKEVERQHIIEIVNAVAFDRGSEVQSNRVKEMLSSFFSWAIDQAKVTNHPCFRLKDVGLEKAGERYLSLDEIKNYWYHSASLSPQNRGYLRLLLLLGLRPGECMGLRWDWIDANVVTIPSSAVKTRNEHQLPLPIPAQTELDVLRAVSSSEFLFPSDDRRSERKDFQDGRDKLIKLMNCAPWVLRDVRRTAETHMRRIGLGNVNGVDAVSEVLNHGRDRIRTHYDKNTYLAEKSEALTRWAKHIEDIAGGKIKNVHHLDDYRRQDSVAAAVHG